MRFYIFLLIILLISNCYADSWNCINRTALECNTWRMLVPHGWIVASDNSAGGGEHGYAMIFYPDENHDWK